MVLCDWQHSVGLVKVSSWMVMTVDFSWTVDRVGDANIVRFYCIL